MQARRLKSRKRRSHVKNSLDNNKVSRLSNIYNWICNILCSPDQFCCKIFLTRLSIDLFCPHFIRLRLNTRQLAAGSFI